MKFKKFFNSYVESITDYSDIESRKYVQRLAQTIHLLNDLGYISLSTESVIQYTTNVNVDSLFVESKTLQFDYDVYSPDHNKNVYLIDYFFNALRINKKNFFLTPYSKKELSQMMLFKVQTINAGFAIKETSDYNGAPTRDIVAVHNNSKVKGIGRDLVFDAIKKDGKTLDHFDGFLSSLYGPMGFNAYALDEWNDDYTPKDWDYAPLDVRDKTYHASEWDKYDITKQNDKKEQYAQGKPDVIYRRIGK